MNDFIDFNTLNPDDETNDPELAELAQSVSDVFDPELKHAEIKAGRRNSAADEGLLYEIRDHATAIHDLLADLGVDLDENEDGEDEMEEEPGEEQEGMVYSSPVKSVQLQDNIIKDYGILFGGKDLTNDEFERGADFGFERDVKNMPVLYDHGLRGIKSKIGRVNAIEEDDKGIVFEIELDRAHKYFSTVQALAQKNALGLSTGALGHMVVRKDGKLKRWIVGEISLTPTPAEPRTMPNPPLKSTTVEVTQQDGEPSSYAGDRFIDPSYTSGDITTMELDQIIAHLDKKMAELEAKTATQLEQLMKEINGSPALKKTGYISEQGGTADRNVKSLGDFFNAVARKDGARLREVYKTGYVDLEPGQEFNSSTKALGESSLTAGGVMVPIEYEPSIYKIAAEQSLFLQFARQVPMGSPVKKMPILDQSLVPSVAGQSGYFGGMYWQIYGEGGTINQTEPKFDEITLQARTIAGYTQSSNELREDAPQIDSELVDIIGQGLAQFTDYLCFRGTGVGGPLGIFNTAARLTVNRAAGGASIDLADTTALMTRMPGSLTSGAFFITHPYGIDPLLQLAIGNERIYTNGALWDKPVRVSEFLSTPGTAGDLWFVNLSAYALGSRRGLFISGSEHAAWFTNQYAWRVTRRFDGQPLVKAPITLNDGTNKISPFVSLS